MKVPAFAKTLRFKLTIWYVAIILLFGALFLVAVNLAMQQSVTGPPIFLSHQIAAAPQTPMEIYRLVRSTQLELLRNYSLIGFAGLVVIGAIGGYFLSGRMLKPVDRVSSLAARISSTNLNERINYEGPDDEIKRLADTFDDMLERLESAFEAQKQFVQDASHELRTPIAIAQTNIEVVEMEDRPSARDYKRLVEVLKLSLDRMSKLSDNLLLLSEGGHDRSRWSAVDMAAILEEVAEEERAQAAAADISLELELPSEEVWTTGDPLSMKQAVLNLVDNAVKYNRRGGWVKVSARTEDKLLIVQVQDNGSGISETDQQRIFDRFYRVDKSRSRAQGGSGLGLAIVKKIVEDHGGLVSIDSTPGGGSTFRIALPQHTPS